MKIGHRRCTDPTVDLCVRCALPWPCPTARSAGGIDNADAARSEPSPVGDATTSVEPCIVGDHLWFAGPSGPYCGKCKVPKP